VTAAAAVSRGQRAGGYLAEPPLHGPEPHKLGQGHGLGEVQPHFAFVGHTQVTHHPVGVCVRVCVRGGFLCQHARGA
jgi:hypothetical protein